MTVVIDCNVLVACLTTRSPYHRIFQALIQKQFHLSISVGIALEYEEIIQHKYSLATAHGFLALLKELPNVHHVNPFYKWRLIDADPDDNKYCDCAIAGQANYLVTEDRHFDVLKSIQFPVVNVISSADFIEKLKT